MTRLTKRTIRTLGQIARRGKPPRWIGFDDVDIAWFLRDHAHVSGRNFRKLRKEHAGLKDDPPNMLTFWPFTKTQANALLREIRENA